MKLFLLLLIFISPIQTFANNLNNPEVLSIGGKYSCAIQNDGSLICWLNYVDTIFTSPPNGNNYLQVSSGGVHVCAIKNDHTLVCWGDNYIDKAQPNGTFLQVSTGTNGNTCAVRDNNALVCWDNKSIQTSPDGHYSQVSLGDGEICAVKTDKTIVCWENNNIDKITFFNEQYLKVSTINSIFCAIKTDNTITCLNNFDDSGVVPLNGQYLDISGIDCGITINHKLVCQDNIAIPTLDDNFLQVSVGKFVPICGVRTDGVVLCWKERDNIIIPEIKALTTSFINIIPPTLPSTTLSGAISQAQFSGGVTNDNKATFKNNFTTTDVIDVIGNITTNPNDSGKKGSIIIVAFLTDSKADGLYMRNGKQWELWDGELKNLTVAEDSKILNTSEDVIIATSLTGLPGSFNLFFGYKINNEIHYNAKPIQFLVTQ